MLIERIDPEMYLPLTPYLYATPDDCNNVAAHVQEETTALATSPDLTVLPAVLNISDVWTSELYLLRTYVVSIIPKAKAKPRPCLRQFS